MGLRVYGVGFRVHFTLFGIILPTIELKVYTFWGLRTQQLRIWIRNEAGLRDRDISSDKVPSRRREPLNPKLNPKP